MAPSESLKTIQKRLSIILQDILDSTNSNRTKKDRIAHGFKRRRSIITNAKQHRHRQYVFNIDLSDFFPSINFGRVRGYFIHDSRFRLHKKAATVIAQIACHKNLLPQGSPCSPVISNLIAHLMDVHLVQLSGRVGCTYSRYADDLTFSTNRKTFPPEIATVSDDDQHTWAPGNELTNIVRRSGFALNTSKTNMQYQSARQTVTGLVVNRRINVRHEYRHLVRAMAHRLFVSGSFETYGLVRSNGRQAIKKRPGTLNELQGMLGFIRDVDFYHLRAPYPGVPFHRLPKPVQNECRKKQSIYRSFLIYRNFFVPEKPVILCEGKTDVVYLKCAITSLASDFSQLATIKSDGTVELDVRLFNRPSGTARIMDLGFGGSGDLGNFIKIFKNEAKDFCAPGQQHPVIVLYDNDSGAQDIQKFIKTRSVRVSNGEYYRVFKNLYAVPTPLPNGREKSEIEDFFDSSTKEHLIPGRTFNGSRNIDPKLEYGKKDFADGVLRNWKSINFGGFRSLLAVFTSVMDAHTGATGEV